MPARSNSIEEWWPERDFNEEAREYLLIESRLRLQEQLSHLGAQDVKSVAIFTASVLVVSAAGLLGDLRFDFSVLGILSPVALASTVVTWFFVWKAYKARDIGTGVNVAKLAKDYVGSAAQELRDVALETLVAEFSMNELAIEEKGRWLTMAVYAVALQVCVALAVVIVAELEDVPSRSTAMGPDGFSQCEVTHHASESYAAMGEVSALAKESSGYQPSLNPGLSSLMLTSINRLWSTGCFSRIAVEHSSHALRDYLSTSA